MKRSELKQVISEIVRRKLTEALRSKSPSEAASDVIKVIDYYGFPKEIHINTVGSEPLKIHDINMSDGVLTIDVILPDQNVNEQSGLETDQTMGQEKTKEQNPADVKKQKELIDLKKKQSDLTDKIRKMDAEKQKLEDPIRRKLQDLERKKVAPVKALGSITKKIQDIENA